jgi:hypothetical protein
LTLIEILIALFIFMVGSLGVLSVFPVAANNAGRVMGETRGNMIAQSAMAQITADSRVNFELPATGSAEAVTPTPAPPNNLSFVRLPSTSYPASTPSPAPKNGYFVTLLDGPGRGQSRFITADAGGWGTALAVPPAVTPPWTPVVVTDNKTPANQVTWTGPGSFGIPNGALPYFPIEHYSITRMGLPERPLVAGEQILQGWPGSPGPYYVGSPYTGLSANIAATWPVSGNANYGYGTFGLNRDLAVRSFVSNESGTAFANGFYAGIANPSNVQYTAIQVDAFATYCGLAADFPLVGGPDPQTTLIAGAQNWPANPPTWPTNPNPLTWPTIPPQLSSHYQVRIVSGTGAGQSRTITSNTATQLTVAPNWATPPDHTSQYEIGWANTIPSNPAQPQNAAWCGQLLSSTGSINGNPFNTFTDGGGGGTPWVPNMFQGKYIYLPNSGQARAIVSNTTNTLTVTPPFNPLSGSLNYYITESRGYVLITSGAATNRVFPIVWDQYDNVNPPLDGHLIVCAGTDFTSLSGIKAARKPNTNFVNGCSYNLQDATTFTVIGNWSPTQLTWPANSGVAPYPTPPYPSMPLVLSAIPDATPINLSLWAAPGPPACPLWFNTLNICTQEYIAGTVSLTNGSPTVTGTGTKWATNQVPVVPGDIFSGPDSVLHRILSVGSDTSLTLADNYTAPSLSPAGYTIFLGCPPNRLALDQHLSNSATIYTSEYSYGVVFSDSGVDPSLPIRADVFVWRNFNPTRDFVENQKPVGHMSGYIRRP